MFANKIGLHDYLLTRSCSAKTAAVDNRAIRYAQRNIGASIALQDARVDPIAVGNEQGLLQSSSYACMSKPRS